MPLSEDERALIEAVPPGSRLTAELKTLVDQNSFTGNKLGVDVVADHIERRLEALGFRTACMVDGKSGRHVVARRAGDGPRVLLIGHTDTVFPPEAPFKAFAIDPTDADRATGPGVADMKGGLVVMLAALDALNAAGRLAGRPITVVVNADEEIGSPTSGDLVRGEAEESQFALTFECGRDAVDGATTLVTARRGVGRLRLHATGVAAHAGTAPDAGVSAVLETAQKVAPLHALADRAKGLSVNVGLLRGGTAGNVVPAECECEIDYRFPDPEAGEALFEAIEEIAGEHLLRSPNGRGLVRTRVVSHLVRPPLVRTDAVAAAAARVIAAGADLGLKLVEEARGGSSDAALAAEAGCVALCGLGVVGGEFHTEREWARLSSLVERARLAALTIARFWHEQGTAT